MGGALGWIAVVLAGVGAAPQTEKARPQITYAVRMVETPGVDWRGRVFDRLKPVTRQGAATVWTIPRDATHQLLDEFSKQTGAKILQAPRVTSWSGAPATVHHRRNQPVVVQAAWNGQDSSTKTESENVRVGWHATVVGRRLDQGILMQVVFEDTVIRAVHHVNVNCAPERSGASTAGERKPSWTGPHPASSSTAMTESMHGVKAGSEGKTAESKACCDSTGSTCKDDAVQKVVLDVPEIDTQEVLGEWLVGRGEALLVSFGAHTAADKSGKAIVKERLAIIEADELVGTHSENPAPVRVLAPQALELLVPSQALATPGQGNVSIVPILPPRAAALAPAQMATPALPSRSIPQGIHADGTPAALPPLPDDEQDEDASASESSEPMPSPQTKKIPQTKPKPTTDAGAKKVEFSAPSGTAIVVPNVSMPSSPAASQSLLPMKSFLLNLPFGQKLRLELEVVGNVAPKTECP